MHSKHFFIYCGLLLMILGLLGFFGILGPTADSSWFGSYWWFDNIENWLFLGTGVVFLGIAYGIPPITKKFIATLFGLAWIIIGAYALFNQNLLGINFEFPVDGTFLIVIGLWALSVGRKRPDGGPKHH